MTSAFRKRIIQGEVNDENAYVMGGVAGHAGVFAPATDVASFAECMLRSGAPILKPETVTALHSAGDLARRARRAPWDGTRRRPPGHRRARIFRRLRSVISDSPARRLWIDPARQLSVTLLTNRTWPNRASQAIREVRPQVHDAIVEAL